MRHGYTRNVSRGTRKTPPLDPQNATVYPQFVTFRCEIHVGHGFSQGRKGLKLLKDYKILQTQRSSFFLRKSRQIHFLSGVGGSTENSNRL